MNRSAEPELVVAMAMVHKSERRRCRSDIIRRYDKAASLIATPLEEDKHVFWVGEAFDTVPSDLHLHCGRPFVKAGA